MPSALSFEPAQITPGSVVLVGGGPGDLAPVDQPRIRDAVREILSAIGEDPEAAELRGAVAQALDEARRNLERANAHRGRKATDGCGGRRTRRGPSSVASQNSTSVPPGVSRQCRVKIKPACATLFIHQKNQA